MVNPRFRTSNFTSEDVSLLLGLVTVHKDIILDKSIDIASNQLKSRTWQKITDNFNTLSRATESREPLSLKRKFETLKYETKELFCKRKELGETEFINRWNENYHTMFKLVFLNAPDDKQFASTYLEKESGVDDSDQEEDYAVEFLETALTPNGSPHSEENQPDALRPASVNLNIDNVAVEVTINQETNDDIYNSKSPDVTEIDLSEVPQKHYSSKFKNPDTKSTSQGTYSDLVQQLKKKTLKDTEVKLKLEKLTFFQLRNERLRMSIQQVEEKSNRKRQKHQLKMSLLRQKLKV